MLQSWTDTVNRQWDAAAIDTWLEEMDCGQYSEAFKGRINSQRQGRQELTFGQKTISRVSTCWN